MTKVNVDVQVLVTGPTGSGKGLVMNRIREALGDMVSNRVAQIEGFEREYADGGLFKLKGELAQNAGPESPKERHSTIPGYPDTNKMLDYLVSKVSRVDVLKELLNHAYSQPKTEPFKVVVVHSSGTVVEWREGEPLHGLDRVVTLLTSATADAPTDPVGMDQAQAQTVRLQPSGATPRRGFHMSEYFKRRLMGEPALSVEEQLEQAELRYEGELRNSQALEKVVKDYQDRKVITLTEAEIQSGLDRVRWAEGLIRQLPKDHDGRNSWLMNYGQMSDEYAKEFIANVERCKPKTETETGAPEDHTHNKAFETLNSLCEEVRGKFKEHSGVKGSIMKGEFWLILGNGSMVPVKDYIYQEWDCNPECVPVYYAER